MDTKSNKKYSEIISEIDNLSLEKLLFLYDHIVKKKELIINPNSLGNSILEEHRLSCPQCGSLKIYKNGYDVKGKQKFICPNCGKTIRATNNTIFKSSKLSNIQWNKFIKCFINVESLNTSAEEADVSKTTANLMRHKLFECLKDIQKDIKLKNTIWLDEFQTRRNCKGPGFNLIRPKREHGKDSIYSITDDSIIILLGIDDNDNIIAKFIGYGKTLEQDVAYKNLREIVEPKSTIITDFTFGYNTLISNLNLNVKSFKSTDLSSEALLEKKSMDDLCSNLSDFLYGFHGIKDKYLQDYLNYFVFLRYLKYHEEKMTDKIINTFSKAVTEGYTLRLKDLYEL